MKSTQTTNRIFQAARKEIHDEKLRAYALLDLVDELCFTLDHDFRITYVNRYTIETFDKSAQELIGQSLNEIFPYTNGMFDIATFTQRLNSGQTITAEIQSPLSGSWYQTVSMAFEDEYLIYMSETSTTKRYEELLYEKDSLLLAVTNAISENIIIIDPSGRIRFHTPAVCQLTGITADELEDRKLFEFIAVKNHESLQNDLNELAQRPGEVSSFLISVKHKDGSFVELHATAQNLLKQPGVDGILLKLTH